MMLPRDRATVWSAMSTDGSEKRFLIGLLVGLGVGFATAVLLASSRGARGGSTFRERALDLADRVVSLGRSPETIHQRRLERMRTAGF
jgi:gas vesicle protein